MIEREVILPQSVTVKKEFVIPLLSVEKKTDLFRQKTFVNQILSTTTQHIGQAPYNTKEDENKWKITTLIYDELGVLQSKQISENKKWTDYKN